MVMKEIKSSPPDQWVWEVFKELLKRLRPDIPAAAKSAEAAWECDDTDQAWKHWSHAVIMDKDMGTLSFTRKGTRYYRGIEEFSKTNWDYIPNEHTMGQTIKALMKLIDETAVKNGAKALPQLKVEGVLDYISRSEMRAAMRGAEIEYYKWALDLLIKSLKGELSPPKLLTSKSSIID